MSRSRQPRSRVALRHIALLLSLLVGPGTVLTGEVVSTIRNS
jgi:hypothetical protein